MDEQSARLSHSISRLLGTADGEVHEQTEDSEPSMVSTRTEVTEGERYVSAGAVRTNVHCTKAANANLPSLTRIARNMESDAFNYPWMTIKRSSKAKKKTSKRSFVVYRRIPCSQCLVNRR